MITIRPANTEEYNDIRSFYHRLIDMMQDAEYKTAWKKGVYPSDNYLMESLENRELWVCEYNNEYAAAMILNHKSNEGYKKINWFSDAENHEVTVIHALGVLTTFQGKGIAGAMVKKAIETAEAANQKAIRLDVLCGNLPAEKLYIKHGFKYVDTVSMFYEDTGWTDFKLFEYVI